jgi:hypothetical protein
MTKPRRLALLCAGLISRSPVSRIPRLAEHLGAVKSINLRVASRAVNSLHAGTAVEDFESFAESRVVILSVPEDQVHKYLRQLADSPIDWRGKCLLLASESLDSGALSLVEERGAWVGSFHAIEGFEPRRFLIEGSSEALREMKELLEAGGVKVVPIRRGAKSSYLAGVTLAGALVMPLLAASVECLHDSGMTLISAQGLVQKVMERSTRQFWSSGRKAWNTFDPAQFEVQAKALESIDPKLASFFRSTVQQSAQRMGSRRKSGASKKRASTF